ncbi:unnamed protein product, partial [Musa banksii]
TRPLLPPTSLPAPFVPRLPSPRKPPAIGLERFPCNANSSRETPLSPFSDRGFSSSPPSRAIDSDGFLRRSPVSPPLPSRRCVGRVQAVSPEKGEGAARE